MEANFFPFQDPQSIVDELDLVENNHFEKVASYIINNSKFYQPTIERIEDYSLDCISVIKNILSYEECFSIIEASEKVGFQQQQFFGENKDSSFCTVYSPLLSNSIFERLKRILLKETYFDSRHVVLDQIKFLSNKQPIHQGFLDCCYPSIRVARYETGQSLKVHRDTCKKIKGKDSYTVYSLIIYLNDNYEGGQTSICKSIDTTKEGELYLFINIQGKRGDALLLRQEIMHRGTVVSGCKYVLRLDITYRLKI